MADLLNPTADDVVLEAVVPVLRVADIDASIHFYECLGFREEWRHQLDASMPRLMGVEQHGLRLMLTEHDVAPPGAVVYFELRGVDALVAMASRHGIAPEIGPVDQPWGKREVYFRDRDGNQLRFGEVTRPASA